MNKTKIEYLDRFWGNVEKGTDCWIWQAGKFDNGYGQFRVGNKKIKAHRFAWEAVNGPIPEGIKVLHKCDNPPCVNPDHLFLGTNRDNTVDALIKGRIQPAKNLKHFVGEESPNAKLTDVSVLQIREAFQSGRSKYWIAKKFGIAQSTVTQIVTGVTWRHLLCNGQK